MVPDCGRFAAAVSTPTIGSWMSALRHEPLFGAPARSRPARSAGKWRRCVALEASASHFPSMRRCRSWPLRCARHMRRGAGRAARRRQNHAGAARAGGTSLGRRARKSSCSSRAGSRRAPRPRAWRRRLARAVGASVGYRVRFGSKVSRCDRASRWSPKASSRASSSRIPRSTASPPCCSTSSTSARSMPISALALARDVQQGLREDLKLLVMSATLDGARVGKLAGRRAGDRERGPRLSGRDPLSRTRPARMPIERQVADAVLRALRAEAGSLLVFLPGAAEIRRTETLLRERVSRSADRYRAALRRARRRGAGPGDRAGAARPPQGRAGDLDRRDLADHRRRARGDRLRARAGAAL